MNLGQKKKKAVELPTGCKNSNNVVVTRYLKKFKFFTSSRKMLQS